MELKNLLSSEFTREMQKGEGVTTFFEALREMDKHILFIPFGLVSPGIYTAAYPKDGIDYFDAASYSLAHVRRATDKRTVKKVAIDTLLDAGGDNIDDFIEELLIAKDAMFVLDSGTFFVTDEAFRELAKLSRLSGEALKHPSLFRDDYISSLVVEKCVDYAKKRTPQNAFTAIAVEQFGVKRIISFRSGKYEAIPQTVLKTAFYSMIERDDWGAVECRDWKIDHSLSYVDLEFPDIVDSIMSAYPEFDAKLSGKLVPGVRLSTGSTGDNSLKATMTWRLADSNKAALLQGVTQKHCKTYDMTNFIEEVHKNIWDKFGELPARLAELIVVDVSGNSEILASYVESVYKELQLNKVFMLDDGPAKTDKTDYKTKIVDHVVEGLIWKSSLSAFDVAIKIMSVADELDIAESYRDGLRNKVAKAAYCKVFDELLRKVGC